MPGMVPAYFQASKWLRGYMQGPFYDGGYTAPRAQAYADGILSGLADPNRPGAALTRVRKTGMDADASQRDLTYIRPAWMLPGQPFVLDQACGFPGPNRTQAGMYTGRTAYATWQHAFSQLFTQDPDFLQPTVQAAPLFSVIDTDSAHHLSAPLVERAVRWAATAAAALAQPAARTIVINFDAHEDYGGGATAPSINCQSWGCYVTNPVPAVHAAALADAYVQLGSKDPRTPRRPGPTGNASGRAAPRA